MPMINVFLKITLFLDKSFESSFEYISERFLIPYFPTATGTKSFLIFLSLYSDKTSSNLTVFPV